MVCNRERGNRTLFILERLMAASDAPKWRRAYEEALESEEDAFNVLKRRREETLERLKKYLEALGKSADA